MTTSVVATTAALSATLALGAAVVFLRLALRDWTRRTADATDRQIGAVVTADVPATRPTSSTTDDRTADATDRRPGHRSGADTG